MTSVDITYGVLRERSERLAAAFAELGLRAGDRIATLMGKSGEYLVTVMAIWRLGAVHVPLFTAFASAAVAFRLRASGSKLVVCDPSQLPKLSDSKSQFLTPACQVVVTGAAQAPAIGFGDLLAAASRRFAAAALGGHAPIVQIYTSGTTGTPKGVLVPWRAAASFQIYARYGLGIRDDDVFWNAADPGWAYGLYYGIITTFLTRVRSILFEGAFSPQATLQILAEFSVTNFAAAPTVFRSLRASGLSIPDDVRLRRVSSAGEPLTAEVNDWANAALRVPVHDHYGQTETGMLIGNHHHPELRKPLRKASMGQALPGWKAVVLKNDRDSMAAVAEPGRLAMELTESPLAWFDGYEGEPARSAEKLTADRRWYLTGDCGWVDADGYFYFAARDDDLIIMAGYRIGPLEVEAVIVTHEAVYECAVVAGPDELRGEVLEAFVVLREGFSADDALTTQLQERVKTQYAAHAYPRRVHYVESLPKTPSGKVQRFVLRQLLSQRPTPAGK